MTLPASPVVARDIMATRLITLRHNTDVFDAIDILLKYRISGAPVIDEAGKYVGVFSERCSISLLMSAVYEGLPTTEIHAFVDRDAATISPETDLLTMAQMFQQTSFRRLPVLDEGELVGQVSRRDLLRAARKLLEQSPQPGGEVLYLSGLSDPSDSSILVRSMI
ncbi:MAG: CBS domain-containing protein [Planctomycetaceae bacterium]